MAVAWLFQCSSIPRHKEVPLDHFKEGQALGNVRVAFLDRRARTEENFTSPSHVNVGGEGGDHRHLQETVSEREAVAMSGEREPSTEG